MPARCADPVDLSIHRAMCPFACPPRAYPVPTVVHLHGGEVPFLSDGNPEAFFTPYYECRGRLYNPLYLYPNDQGYATLWYHDHCLGFTRLNVYAGLAGFYLIRSDFEKRLIRKRRLPAPEYEQLLLIQDRDFVPDGSLYYPFRPPTPEAPCPSVQPEFFGGFILVNGMTWPFKEVEPRHYRVRFLNGSNTRTYRLYFERPDHGRMPFHVIGTEHELLRRPVEVTSLDIASGERYDVVIDFSCLEHEHILLGNDLVLEDDPASVGKIMQFRVEKRLDCRIPDICLPRVLRHGPPHEPQEPVARVRQLMLGEVPDELGRTKHLLGTVEDGLLEWSDPITESPHIGTAEIWEIYSTTPDMHPIHLHLVSFRIIDRQRFTAEQVSPGGGLVNIELIGDPMPPADYEKGNKDTFMAQPGEVTRIYVKFEEWCGEYVWHCHILEHEDHEMMRPYCVIGPRERCGDPSLDLVPPPRACGE